MSDHASRDSDERMHGGTSRRVPAADVERFDGQPQADQVYAELFRPRHALAEGARLHVVACQWDLYEHEDVRPIGGLQRIHLDECQSALLRPRLEEWNWRPAFRFLPSLFDADARVVVQVLDLAWFRRRFCAQPVIDYDLKDLLEQLASQTRHWRAWGVDLVAVVGDAA